MNKAAEFAKRLDGRQYRHEVTSDEETEAGFHHLLVLFASSDDLLEMRGTINDEIGAYNGTHIKVSRDGKFFSSKYEVEQERQSVNFLKTKGYKIVGPARINVELKWSDTHWVVRSDAENQAPFQIFEDDRIFGYGLVIDFS